MKSTIKMTHPSMGDIQFPLLMIDPSDNMIILATAINASANGYAGMVVNIGKSSNPSFSVGLYRAGNVDMYFAASMFKPFDGEVILSN